MGGGQGRDPRLPPAEGSASARRDVGMLAQARGASGSGRGRARLSSEVRAVSGMSVHLEGEPGAGGTDTEAVRAPVRVLSSLGSSGGDRRAPVGAGSGGERTRRSARVGPPRPMTLRRNGTEPIGAVAHGGGGEVRVGGETGWERS